MTVGRLNELASDQLVIRCILEDMGSLLQHVRIVILHSHSRLWDGQPLTQIVYSHRPINPKLSEDSPNSEVTITQRNEAEVDETLFNWRNTPFINEKAVVCVIKHNGEFEGVEPHHIELLQNYARLDAHLEQRSKELPYPLSFRFRSFWYQQQAFWGRLAASVKV